MAYRANPFLERMSESITSDQEFVRLFSPTVMETLPDDVFSGAVHIFRSSPGGGKTTLLRAFTPTALQAFWNARSSKNMSDAYHGLVSRQILDEHNGPQMLGVLLSCASGYADLPPGATMEQEGLFRALLDCRIVLRTLRSLITFLGLGSAEDLTSVQLEYDEVGRDLKSIPTGHTATELLHWAELRERKVYAALDSVVGVDDMDMPLHVRLEGVLWLQSVRFQVGGKDVAPRRLLMIDDLHRLRRKQRALLIDELTVGRSRIPVWLAERSIALGDNLLSQGAREGRELHEHSLELIWSTQRGQFQFLSHAQNILDRRFYMQSAIPSSMFSQHIRGLIMPDDVRKEVVKGIASFRARAKRYRSKNRYTDWLGRAERLMEEATLDALRELFVTQILLVRDENKRQMTLDLGPLPEDELEQRDSSSVRAAADIFMNEELGIPYYFGIDQLCVMATSNVEELLTLAAALYEAMLAKKVLRKSDLTLSPHEQEKVLRDVAKRKHDFIPKNHTEGSRAQRLLDSIGSFCRERTFLPNAPIAPGVTGVRLNFKEFGVLNSDEHRLREQRAKLKRVLAECAAENLLILRDSSATNSRESGCVFYLNRTLCAHYGLPLQLGGWQDVTTVELSEWMETGRSAHKHEILGLE